MSSVKTNQSIIACSACRTPLNITSDGMVLCADCWTQTPLWEIVKRLQDDTIRYEDEALQ